MKIDDLIRTYCPEGVERVRLEEVCKITTGKLNANAMVDGGEYAFFTCSDTIYQIDNYAFDCEALLVAGNGYLGNVKYFKGKFNAYQRTYVLYDFIEGIEAMFLFYCMKAFFRDYAIAAQKDGSVPYITLGTLQSFEIPLPPLPIQQTIASYLDKLTSLTAELEAELELQKKRYDFYRNRLLSFAPDSTTQFDARLNSTTPVKWMKLGEIAEIIRGGNFQKKDFVESGYPCIHYGQIYTHYGTSATETITYVGEDVFCKSKKAQPNDIVMAVTSENIEDVCKCVAWIGKEPIAVSGHTAIIHHQQNAKYLSYYFHTAMFAEQKKKLVHGTKVIEVTPKALEEILIPLPPLSEQERIVGILDKYETLVHNTQEGIPALIAAVKQKYEYYRERMLTF